MTGAERRTPVRRGGRAPARLLALIVCLLVLTGAGFPPASITPTYTAETVLCGEAVCPVLLPGNTDGSVTVRWLSLHSEPVDVLYAPDDGTGEPGAAWTAVRADSAPSGVYTGYPRLNVYQAELPLAPGSWLYGLAPAGETPSVLYPVVIRREGTFRAVMSSDSHMSNFRQAAVYDETVLTAAGQKGADLIIHTGDVIDDADADPFVLGQDASHTRSIPTLAVPGNHDRSVVLYEYLSMPHSDRATGDYWTVQGNVLFVGLNIDVRYPDGHAQYLRETVPAHREGCDWVVVLIHYSLMSSGYHARDQVMYDLRKALAPVLRETDVDLVLSGHDHMYCRSVLCDGEERIPFTAGERVDKHPGETMYITLPTATGTKFYEPIPGYPDPPRDQVAVEALRYARGYVTADFRKESVEFNAWNADTGERVDHFILTRAH